MAILIGIYVFRELKIWNYRVFFTFLLKFPLCRRTLLIWGRGEECHSDSKMPLRLRIQVQCIFYCWAFINFLKLYPFYSLKGTHVFEGKHISFSCVLFFCDTVYIERWMQKCKTLHLKTWFMILTTRCSKWDWKPVL